jgi:hypothetical protein
MPVRDQLDDRFGADGVSAVVGFPVKPAAAAVGRRHGDKSREGTLGIRFIGDPQLAISDAGAADQRDRLTARGERGDRAKIIERAAGKCVAACRRAVLRWARRGKNMSSVSGRRSRDVR